MSSEPSSSQPEVVTTHNTNENDVITPSKVHSSRPPQQQRSCGKPSRSPTPTHSNHLNRDSGLTFVPPEPMDDPVNNASSTERTRLIDPEAQVPNETTYVRGRLLDPSDPIVSPLNLDGVQVLSKFLHVLNVVNFVVLAVLVLNDFYNLGLNNNNYNYDASLEEIELLVLIGWIYISLGFLDVVGRGGIRINFAITSLFVILELFYSIFDYYQFPLKYGVFLIFLKFWKVALLILVNVLDYWTLQGKEDQELKYTGRIENRRTLTEWFKLLVKNSLKGFILTLLSLLVLNKLLYKYDEIKLLGNQHNFTSDLKCASDACTAKYDIQCFGDLNSTAQPLIIYESGYYESSKISSKWIKELYHLGRVDHYCIYDRPGYGLSTSLNSPNSYKDTVTNLKNILERDFTINQDLKYLLVGYNQGGIFSRLFATLHKPSSIDSILLIDSWDEDVYMNNGLYTNLTGSIPRLSSYRNFKRYISSLFHKFGLVQQYSWLIKWQGSSFRFFHHEYLRFNVNWLRSKFQEYLTFKLISVHDIVNSKEHLLNTRISIVSSNILIKKNDIWGILQKNLIKISKDIFDWKIVELDNEQDLVYENAAGVVELQNALLRLMG